MPEQIKIFILLVAVFLLVVPARGAAVAQSSNQSVSPTSPTQNPQQLAIDKLMLGLWGIREHYEGENLTSDIIGVLMLTEKTGERKYQGTVRETFTRTAASGYKLKPGEPESGSVSYNVTVWVNGNNIQVDDAVIDDAGNITENMPVTFYLSGNTIISTQLHSGWRKVQKTWTKN